MSMARAGSAPIRLCRHGLLNILNAPRRFVPVSTGTLPGSGLRAGGSSLDVVFGGLATPRQRMTTTEVQESSGGPR